MKKLLLALLFFTLMINLKAQEIPYYLEELTATEFIDAVDKSSKTCILPIGVFEKHGSHLPLGTDLYIAREIASRAAAQEYTVVYPWYYFSQINEARHQPGTIAYSPELIWKVLQETLDELSRNGFEKIIIVNGHGGNNAFLDYFGMSQLSERRDYTLYWFRPTGNPEVSRKVEELTQPDPYDSHGGNTETSAIAAIRPDLAHTEKASEQSGVNQQRLSHLSRVYTGIWWYANYPNHYGGDGSKSNAEAGELILNARVEQLVQLIRDVKNDEIAPALQKQFFDEAEQPLNTKQ